MPDHASLAMRPQFHQFGLDTWTSTASPTPRLLERQRQPAHGYVPGHLWHGAAMERGQTALRSGAPCGRLNPGRCCGSQTRTCRFGTFSRCKPARSNGRDVSIVIRARSQKSLQAGGVLSLLVQDDDVFFVLAHVEAEGCCHISHCWR